MSEELYSIVEATIAFDGSHPGAGHARLIVYFDAESSGGPQQDDSKGSTRIIEIPDGAEVTFGRSRGSTVHVDSERVSRTHARLSRQAERFTIEDLGSRNGTRVNGKKIAEGTRLRSGDELSIGPITAILSVTSGMLQQRAIGSTSYLEERLAAEVDRGRRYQRRFALLLFNLEGDLVECDVALSHIVAQLRPMDVLAEYGPEDLALLTPESDANSARNTANAIAEAAASQGVQARVGIALFPEHGTQEGALISQVRAALRTARAGADAPIAMPPTEPTRSDSDIVVSDPQMERVFALVRKVADHPITVLINGETGVGKEVVAEAVHKASKRRDKPYVRLNCASIPETLLESELFGHEKGSFTGAERRKIGYFEAADGGTIFLDEIGEIRESVQSKLLRVLEEHKISRVGGTKEIAVDVRVVCATNRDLEAEVGRGAFREDLFFRISAFTIVVPPLRDRPAEIALLAEHFLRHAARESGIATPTLAPTALEALRAHSWPGNVRELRNAIERALVLHSNGLVEIDDLPDRVRAAGHSTTADPNAVDLTGDMRNQIADVERATIVRALEACGGNQTRTAKKLGLSRRALIYKMEKYGLKPPPAKKPK